MNDFVQKISLRIFVLCVAILSGGFVQSVSAAEQNRKAEALAHYIMGLLNEWNETADQGIEEYQKALTLDPDRYAIYLRLGINYGRLGEFDKALDALQRATQLNSEDVEAHYLMAIIYSAQENHEKANATYETILQRVADQNPESSEIPLFLGQFYYSEGKISQAITAFENSLQKSGPDANLYSILGSLYLDLPDRVKAKEYFRRSIQLDPQNDGSLNSLGYMYAEDGENLEEALNFIQRALDIDPENGAYLDSLGWVYYQKGDYEKARLFLERAIQFMQDPIIYDHLGDAYLKLQDFAGALRSWEKSLELLPDQDFILQKIQSIQAVPSAR